MYTYLKNNNQLVRHILNLFIEKDMVVCDCTMGNGNDTRLLSNLVGEKGRVYSFDIQKQAIDRTKESLVAHGNPENYKLILDGHENIDKYIRDQIDLFIYNLGYLPRADKKITTKPKTSIESMSKALKLLKNNGLLIVTCYTGHEGGLEEQLLVEDFLRTLDQRKYHVVKHDFINMKNNPPIVYCVEKNNNN